MITNHGDPKMEFYVLKLTDDPWSTAEADFTIESVFGEDGEPLKFQAGGRVLSGYFYSLRRGADRYELHDAAYAARCSAATRSRRTEYAGWPLVHFKPDMVLHVDFHMMPVASTTKTPQKWYLLDSDDRDSTLAALRAMTKT